MKLGETITELTGSKLKGDFSELRKEYPFSRMVYVKADLICFEVWTYSSTDLAKFCLSFDEIKLVQNSRRAYLIAREDYVRSGALVYAFGGWDNLSRIEKKDQHFYNPSIPEGIEYGPLLNFIKNGGREVCVCVPSDVPTMDNPLLENVKTLDHMLAAYDQVIRGKSDRVVLHAYSHGLKGIEEYEKDRRRNNRKRIQSEHR